MHRSAPRSFLTLLKIRDSSQIWQCHVLEEVNECAVGASLAPGATTRGERISIDREFWRKLRITH
jgi:hypothetical protein